MTFVTRCAGGHSAAASAVRLNHLTTSLPSSAGLEIQQSPLPTSSSQSLALRARGPCSTGSARRSLARQRPPTRLTANAPCSARRRAPVRRGGRRQLGPAAGTRATARPPPVSQRHLDRRVLPGRQSSARDAEHQGLRRLRRARRPDLHLTPHPRLPAPSTPLPLGKSHPASPQAARGARQSSRSVTRPSRSPRTYGSFGARTERWGGGASVCQNRPICMCAHPANDHSLMPM